MTLQKCDCIQNPYAICHSVGYCSYQEETKE